MRPPVDEARLRALAHRLAGAARQPTRVYLTGGATAVIEGWRASTVDVDLRIEPDNDDLLREIPRIKKELQINVELASPPDFIPEVPGWRDRSPLVIRQGHVEIRHFDPYSQALAKIERGFLRDLDDVRAMVARGLVDPPRLIGLYDEIEAELFRYPAIDPASFRAKVHAFVA